MAVVYHWKHGWIPLTHEAALSKAKGSHTLAAKYLADAPHATGIGSRSDMARAVLDLPNLPSSHLPDAHGQLIHAAADHKAHDLLPKPLRLQIRPAVHRGETGHSITGVDTHGRRVNVFVPGDREHAERSAANLKAGRPAFADHKDPAWYDGYVDRNWAHAGAQWRKDYASDVEMDPSLRDAIGRRIHAAPTPSRTSSFDTNPKATPWHSMTDGSRWRETPAGLVIERGGRELHLLGTSTDSQARAKQLISGHSFDRLFKSGKKSPGQKNSAYIKL